MPSSTTANLPQDVSELWKHEIRSFLGYVVDCSSPVMIDELDQEMMEVFKERHARELELAERTLLLLSRLGINADAPAYDIAASTYNFMRAVALGETYLKLSAQGQSRITRLRERYAAAEVLEERLLNELLLDTAKLREESRARIQKILDKGRALRGAGDGGVPVEEEEVPAGVEGEFPWHDESLALDERMGLAKTKGLFEKLFAAMAQTDCTACGYDCEGYARAIADGEEKDLTKCAPGELETQHMLESLMKGAK